MAVPPHTPQGDPPKDIQVEEKSTNWLAWLLLLLGLAALLWWLLARDNDDVVADANNPQVVATTDDNAMAGVDPLTSDPAVVGDTGVTDPNDASERAERPLSQLTGYIAGTDPTPAIFTFERLNFSTDSIDILPADQAEVDAMADALKTRESVRVKVTGYADPRGATPYNQKLAKDRAEAVKARLVADGIAANRIETESGGETLPDAGTVTQARAAARRTSITILSR